MKRFILSFTLLFASITAAQSQQRAAISFVAPVTGPLKFTNDIVPISISGQVWATVRFTSDATFNGTVQQQYSTDNGKNWLNAPYAKRIDAISANPTMSATVSFSAATQLWEVPLPSNATDFSVKATSITAGSSTAVTLSAGTIYNPGAPVIAVLYDVTSGAGVALDTGTIEVSGWSLVEHWFSMNGGTPAFSIQEVDDTGTSSGNIVTGTAAFLGGMGASATLGGSAGLSAATASIPLPRRVRYQSGAITSQTSRIRVVARR